MYRLSMKVCMVVCLAVCAGYAFASDVRLVGHRTLQPGPQAQAQLASDRVVCEAQANQVRAEMATRLANAPSRNMQELDAVGGWMEGRKQAEIQQAANNAALSAMLTCMTDRGWLFARR